MIPPYSYFKLSTGFLFAALYVWLNIEIRATSKVIRMVNRKIVKPMEVRTAEAYSRRLFEAKYATGSATMLDIKISFRKEVESNLNISDNEAPRTFRTPISFVLCLTVYEESANKPRQEKNTAIIPSTESNSDIRYVPPLYFLLKYSSKVKFSNGMSGENSFQARCAYSLTS